MSTDIADHADHLGHQHHGAPGYLDTKDAHLKRLRRIEGQVRGLQRLINDDTYCIDVLTQVSAATRALESFALGLLEEHLSHCVAQALATGGVEADEKVKEASAAIARLVRS
ncbi:MAG TPA: metal-sensitive transcriptional regulator [Nocardioidaceae bacterium]|nr:metal-sensitive transcriptional regulator [Nocardioidaceae bacterium]